MLKEKGITPEWGECYLILITSIPQLASSIITDGDKEDTDHDENLKDIAKYREQQSQELDDGDYDDMDLDIF